MSRDATEFQKLILNLRNKINANQSLSAEEKLRAIRFYETFYTNLSEILSSYKSTNLDNLILTGFTALFSSGSIFDLKNTLEDTRKRNNIFSKDETWQILLAQGDDLQEFMRTNFNFLSEKISQKTALNPEPKNGEELPRHLRRNVVKSDFMMMFYSIIDHAKEDHIDAGSKIAALAREMLKPKESQNPGIIAERFIDLASNEKVRDALLREENLNRLVNLIVRSYDVKESVRESFTENGLDRKDLIDFLPIIKYSIRESLTNPESIKSIKSNIRIYLNPESNEEDRYNALSNMIFSNKDIFLGIIKEHPKQLTKILARKSGLKKKQVEKDILPTLEIFAEYALAKPENKEIIADTLQIIEFAEAPEDRAPLDKSDYKKLLINLKNILSDEELKEKLNEKRVADSLAKIIAPILAKNKGLSENLNKELFDLSTDIGKKFFQMIIDDPDQLDNLSIIAENKNKESVVRAAMNILSDHTEFSEILVPKEEESKNYIITKAVKDSLKILFNSTKEEEKAKLEFSEKVSEFVVPLVLEAIKNDKDANTKSKELIADVAKQIDEINKLGDIATQAQVASQERRQMKILSNISTILLDKSQSQLLSESVPKAIEKNRNLFEKEIKSRLLEEAEINDEQKKQVASSIVDVLSDKKITRDIVKLSKSFADGKKLKAALYGIKIFLKSKKVKNLARVALKIRKSLNEESKETKIKSQPRPVTSVVSYRSP